MGKVIRDAYVEELHKKIVKKYKLKMHLDGARCLNAAAFLKVEPADMCRRFDTISVCLSKGLGCPIGSLVVGSKADIEHALILRKLLGGNLRQAGILAQAAVENLKTWRPKLEEDHKKALYMAEKLQALECLEVETENIETNMFRFRFRKGFKAFKHDSFTHKLRDDFGILMNFGHKNEAIRVVTH